MWEIFIFEQTFNIRFRWYLDDNLRAYVWPLQIIISLLNSEILTPFDAESLALQS